MVKDDVRRRGAYQNHKVSHVASDWLAEEAKAMSSKGTPKRPVLVGGSGLCGSNLMVLLANSPGCERITVLDALPMNPAVLSDAGLGEDKVTFVQHIIGTDSENALAATLAGSDCVYCMVTPHVQLAAEAEFYKTNVNGVEEVIRACKSQKVARLVFLSSIATTNHFVPSTNQTEADGLPSWDLYTSPYDITKRRGEEMVLAASCSTLQTCALRPGGILLSPHDFTFSNVLMLKCMLPDPKGLKTIDFIDGRDVARGMLLSSQFLGLKPKGVAGEAFFLTKGFNCNPGNIAAETKKHLGWPMLPVPLCITKMTCFIEHVKYIIMKCLRMTVSGVPPHKFMGMAFIQQEFNNSKINQVLGFSPKCSLPDAVGRICALYKKEKGK